MSARALSLGGLGDLIGRPAKSKPKRGKGRGKSKAAARRKAVPAEYSMLLTATLCLLALGAVMVFSASSTTRILQDGGLSDSAFYLKRTLLFGTVGLIAMHLVARHKLSVIRNLTPALVAVAFFLLCAVLVAGNNVNGATRWLGSGFLQIQPSEIAKVALIFYGADMLARKPKRARSIEGFMPFLLVVGAPAAIRVAPTAKVVTIVVPMSGSSMISIAAAPTTSRNGMNPSIERARFGLRASMSAP